MKKHKAPFSKIITRKKHIPPVGNNVLKTEAKCSLLT
jgi:hypothetical protein